MAVPTFVNVGTAQTGSGSPLSNTGAPASRSTDDIEVSAFIANAAIASEISVSGSGWLLIGAWQFDGASDKTLALAWRRYNGTNVNPSWNFTTATSCYSRRWARRGCWTGGTPVAVIGTPGTGSGSTHTSVGGNTTAGDSVVDYVDGCANNSNLAQPSGWTEQFDAGASGHRLSVGSKDISGSSGQYSGDISVAGGARFVQIQIEFLSQAPGGGSQNLSVSKLGPVGHLYTPTLSPGNANLSIAKLGPAGHLYAPTLSPGGVNLAIGFKSASGALYAPTLSPGNADLTLSFLGASGALYAPDLVPGSDDQTLTVGFLGPNGALYAPALNGEAPEAPAAGGGTGRFAGHVSRRDVERILAKIRGKKKKRPTILARIVLKEPDAVPEQALRQIEDLTAPLLTAAGNWKANADAALEAKRAMLERAAAAVLAAREAEDEADAEDEEIIIEALMSERAMLARLLAHVDFRV